MVTGSAAAQARHEGVGSQPNGQPRRDSGPATPRSIAYDGHPASWGRCTRTSGTVGRPARRTRSSLGREGDTATAVGPDRRTTVDPGPGDPTRRPREARPHRLHLRHVAHRHRGAGSTPRSVPGSERPAPAFGDHDVHPLRDDRDGVGDRARDRLAVQPPQRLSQHRPSRSANTAHVAATSRRRPQNGRASSPADNRSSIIGMARLGTDRRRAARVILFFPGQHPRSG